MHYDAIGATANTDGTTYTWSVFARAAERTEIALLGGAEDAVAYFDLVAGTARWSWRRTEGRGSHPRPAPVSGARRHHFLIDTYGMLFEEVRSIGLVRRS